MLEKPHKKLDVRRKSMDLVVNVSRLTIYDLRSYFFLSRSSNGFSR